MGERLIFLDLDQNFSVFLTITLMMSDSLDNGFEIEEIESEPLRIVVVKEFIQPIN